MNTSVDGYVEGPKGAMDWFSPDNPDHWREVFAVLDHADTFVVGATMYPDYGNAWTEALTSPKSSDNERQFARIVQRTKHVVVSRTMQKAEYFQTSIVRDLESVARLKDGPGKDIFVWGGATLASAILRSGIADELHLEVNPVLLGGGKALFKDMTERRRLTLAGSQAFGTGVVLLRYQTRAA
jgi:dihydrofolate reductase